MSADQQIHSNQMLPSWHHAAPELSYASKSLFAKTDQLIRRCMDAYKPLEEALAESSMSVEQFVELVSQIQSKQDKSFEMLRQLEWALQVKQDLKNFIHGQSQATQIRPGYLVRRL